uniref:Pyruvate kinase barrel domain-containing protein n=1 Tax=Glossina brevipalpis TaxID=37001 RepID=A0A1A9WEB3_9MUSC
MATQNLPAENRGQAIEAEGDFTVLLNGPKDLDFHLQEFKKACTAHEKRRKKRCRRRYYNLGLMAKIVRKTTEDELRRLLKNGIRTFLVDTVTNKPNEVEDLVVMLNHALEEHQNEDTSVKLVTGLAVEITGDCCRVSRLHNNCSIFLNKGDITNLTIDAQYMHSSFKEIMYVINFKYYLSTLKLCDEIKIGREVRGKIVKKLKNNVAVFIEDPGLINSYEYVELPNQCYSLQLETMPNMFNDDLALATKVNADFIVMPFIRCMPFLNVLRFNLKEHHNFKLIGTIDLEYVISKMLDLTSIIKLLDFLWLPHLFNLSPALHAYTSQDVIPIAKCLRKPVIGTVPLECCSDFKVFENHEFLWKIDCIFIEKSQWCDKYPLIVKKLLPIKDFRIGVVENAAVVKDIRFSYQSVVNFIIRTISSIECQAIFLYSKCEEATIALARAEIYCPVYVVLPLQDEDQTEVKLERIELAKSLHLRRNLRCIVYTKEMNVCDYKPIEFGIEYGRRNGCLDTGDFVITLEVCKSVDNKVQLGVREDVVIMRAFYVPVPVPGEKYLCN